MQQPKIERLLRVIKLMTGPIDYTVDELAEKLETSPRTVYRYVDTFKEAGFVVYKKGSTTFKLGKESRGVCDLDQLVNFTPEEARIVGDLLSMLSDSNALKQNLRKKLAAVYECTNMATETANSQAAQNIHELTSIISRGECAILRGYSSSNSHEVRDRHVEPFAFTDNYVAVWCYDREDNRCKQFRVSRMQEVESTGAQWEHESEHKASSTDAFRLSSFDTKHVEIRMGLRAHNLLTEEYPGTIKDISHDDEQHWTLSTEVCGWEGIGRFALGLLDDIEVVAPEEFRDWLRNRLSKGLSKL